MKRVGTIATCLAAGCLLNSSLRAQDEALPGNPYAVVVMRNIFGLNPPPPVDPNANKPAEPPVKVVPNGIMSIFGQLQVLFKVAAKPGGKDATYMLTEGQSQDDIEVIKIDEKAASVTFNNHGVVQELPLVVTPPSSTPAVAAPTVPTVPGRSLRMPGIMPGGASGGSPFGNRFPPRDRNGTLREDPNSGANLRAVPSRGGANSSQQDLLNSMSPEEKMIMTVAEKAKAFQEGHNSAPIFPPTPLDEDAGIPSNLGQTPPIPGR